MLQITRYMQKICTARSRNGDDGTVECRVGSAPAQPHHHHRDNRGLPGHIYIK